MPSVCTVIYAEDREKTYGLIGEWEFFGFQAGTSEEISYPPCEGYSLYGRDEFRMTLKLYDDSTTLSGKATINQYGGNFRLTNDNGLEIHSITATLMGGTEALEAYENRFFLALGVTKSYNIRYDRLTLFYGPSGDKMLFMASRK
jgi:heat shock protein HslJ